jgi:hypothetical protein
MHIILFTHEDAYADELKGKLSIGVDSLALTVTKSLYPRPTTKDQEQIEQWGLTVSAVQSHLIDVITKAMDEKEEEEADEDLQEMADACSGSPELLTD